MPIYQRGLFQIYNNISLILHRCLAPIFLSACWVIDRRITQLTTLYHNFCDIVKVQPYLLNQNSLFTVSVSIRHNNVIIIIIICKSNDTKIVATLRSTTRSLKKIVGLFIDQKYISSAASTSPMKRKICGMKNYKKSNKWWQRRRGNRRPVLLRSITIIIFA